MRQNCGHKAADSDLGKEIPISFDGESNKDSCFHILRMCRPKMNSFLQNKGTYLLVKFGRGSSRLGFRRETIMPAMIRFIFIYFLLASACPELVSTCGPLASSCGVLEADIRRTNTYRADTIINRHFWALFQTRSSSVPLVVANCE